MLRFKKYDLIIFDCDGVILDSNQLKIDAMSKALVSEGCTKDEIRKCTNYFSKNFGKSRFHHVDVFINEFIKSNKLDNEDLKLQLLHAYSYECKKLYLDANETPYIRLLLQKSKSIKCVASGSEQSELQDVFIKRELSNYFHLILGSPVKKVDLIKNILNEFPNTKAVMIGDAVSDLESARENEIDFIYYSPYSNVDAKMRELCELGNYRILDSFKEVIEEI